VKGTKWLPISAFFLKREELQEACVEIAGRKNFKMRTQRFQIALRQRKGGNPLMFLRIFSCCSINNLNLVIHGASVVWITCQKESKCVPYTPVSTVSQSWSFALASVSTYCLVKHFAEQSLLRHTAHTSCLLYELTN
jgi:hypothetical protein